MSSKNKKNPVNKMTHKVKQNTSINSSKEKTNTKINSPIEKKNNKKATEVRTDFIPFKLENLIKDVNTIMCKNRFQSTSIGYIETDQICAETGKVIKCISCPFGENEFGICEQYKFVPHSDTNLNNLSTHHWKRHHKGKPEKKNIN
jgi:hypothetical protein